MHPVVGHTPLALCALLVSIVVTPRGCVDEVIQPLWCTHVAEGRRNPLLEHVPKLPHPCLNTTQLFVNHSKESKVCAPLVLHVTIVRPRCPCSHPNIFIHPIDRFLPCALHPFHRRIF
jgi:hypothetical protein